MPSPSQGHLLTLLDGSAIAIPIPHNAPVVVFCYRDSPGQSHEGIKVLVSKKPEHLLRCASASLG